METPPEKEWIDSMGGGREMGSKGGRNKVDNEKKTTEFGNKKKKKR